MSIDWRAFCEIIHGNQRFLLTSHIRPDCDALGSELGMAGVLEALGKQVQIVNGQSTPPSLQFIDPRCRIRSVQEVERRELEEIDVLMILDTSAWAQLGPMGEVLRTLPSSVKRIILDHHISEDDLGATPFKNTRAEATGRLVVEAADELGVALTPEIARPLFAALATDTGWFRFSSTDGDTYRFAARLTDAGARPDEIYGDLYERDTLGRVRLRGLILSRVTIEDELASTYVVRDDFERTGAHPSDTEDAINMTLAIDTVRMAVIMIEQLSGGFKISFRSRCHVDCSKVAGTFGGGGHRAAAGAFLDGSLDEVRPRVLEAVRAAMRAGA